MSTGQFPKRDLNALKKCIESLILTETREPEFIALLFCVVGPRCCWDQWLEMMQTDLAKQKAKLGRIELSKRENWAVPQLCLSCHYHQGFYLLLHLKEGAGPQPSSPHRIHIMWFTLQDRISYAHTPPNLPIMIAYLSAIRFSLQICWRINHSTISCS